MKFDAHFDNSTLSIVYILNPETSRYFTVMTVLAGNDRVDTVMTVYNICHGNDRM